MWIENGLLLDDLVKWEKSKASGLVTNENGAVNRNKTKMAFWNVKWKVKAKNILVENWNVFTKEELLGIFC